MCSRYLSFYSLHHNSKYSMYSLCGGDLLQHGHQCSCLYCVYRMYSRNVSFNRLYCNSEYSLPFLRGWIYLQYHNECRQLYRLCSSLYCRVHVSIDGLYCFCKSCLHCLYSLHSRNLSINNLYRSSEYWMYSLCRRIDV